VHRPLGLDLAGRESPGARIVTPDQRLRVFVSSTLQELAAERAAASETIARDVPIPHRSCRRRGGGAALHADEVPDIVLRGGLPGAPPQSASASAVRSPT
jgi:hypothetical protein